MLIFRYRWRQRRYEFSIKDYLKRVESGDAGMEMHILPQARLFRLLENSGLRVLDFQIDGCSGPAFQSVSILAEKVKPRVPKEASSFMVYTGSGSTPVMFPEKILNSPSITAGQ